MKALAIFGGQALDARAPALAFPAVAIGSTTVRGGFVPARMPEVDPVDDRLADQVLVRVRAFSCNFRDRAFILDVQRAPARRFFVLGSEFAGEVVWAGARSGFQAGMRVASNHSYAGNASAPDGQRDGVATNNGSRQLLLVPAHRLVPLPDAVSDEAAAALTLGAQTAYAMVRRLALTQGARVLVTAATSTTGLLAVQRLVHAGAEVYAVTSRPSHAERLRALGARDVVTLARAEEGAERDPTAVVALAQSLGGFDAVVDPFFDLHASLAAGVMAYGGQYITCGLAGQSAESDRAIAAHRADLKSVFALGILKNATFHCNCLGAHQDLVDALGDAAAGLLRPVIDHVTTGDDAATFLRRSFADADRFGKVVHRYGDA